MRGLGLGLGLNRLSGGGGFSPASLTPTAYYDPNDLATVWQDSARTTPGAVNSPVGALDDKSGNGNHLLQATAGKRPILRLSGGFYHLEYDGVDDYLDSTFTLNQTHTRITAFRMVAWSGGGRIMDGSAGNGAGLLMNGASPNIQMYAGAFGPATSALAVGTFGVVTERFSGATSRIAVNNGAYNTADAGSIAAAGLTVAEYGDLGVPANVLFGRIILAARDLSDAEVTSSREWCAAGSGITL